MYKGTILGHGFVTESCIGVAYPKPYTNVIKIVGTDSKLVCQKGVIFGISRTNISSVCIYSKYNTFVVILD